MIEQQVPPKVVFLTSQDYNIFLLCRFGSGTHFINRTGSPLPSLPLGPPSVAPWASRLPASSPPQLPTHHQRWSCHPPPRWLSHSATSPSSFLVSSASCLKLNFFILLDLPLFPFLPPPPFPQSTLPTHPPSPPTPSPPYHVLAVVSRFYHGPCSHLSIGSQSPLPSPSSSPLAAWCSTRMLLRTISPPP